jgi:hypothetical protein
VFVSDVYQCNFIKGPRKEKMMADTIKKDKSLWRLVIFHEEHLICGFSWNHDIKRGIHFH